MAQALGLETRLVTSTSGPPPEVPGVSIEVIPAPDATTFEYGYPKAGRIQRLTGRAAAYTER